MKKLIIVLSLALTACATRPYSPIVDQPGPNYASDLAACQQHATQTMNATEGAASGAVAGAIFGALLGAAFRTSSRDAAWGGALGGAAGGAARADNTQRGIVSRCMSLRGYRVLN